MARGQGKLTTRQLLAIRRRLEEERQRIRAVLERTPAEGAGDERLPEVEEAAQRATERAASVEIAARERALLAEVERAIAKLDAGNYGTSEKTGEPIPFARLRAVPWARQDVDE